jgi:hypothetical protein
VNLVVNARNRRGWRGGDGRGRAGTGGDGRERAGNGGNGGKRVELCLSELDINVGGTNGMSNERDRTLRGEHMSAEDSGSASFAALQTQVRRVREMLTGCEGVVAAVTEIERRLGVGHEKCDFRVWCEVEDELHSAEYCLREMWCDKADLQQQLAATARLVDAARAGGAGAADAAEAVRAGGAGGAGQHCRVQTLLGELAGMRAEG